MTIAKGGEKMNKYSNILKLNSGIYTGKLDNGTEVVVARQVGAGFYLCTEAKNGWKEVRYYDESGYLEAVCSER